MVACSGTQVTVGLAIPSRELDLMPPTRGCRHLSVLCRLLNVTKAENERDIYLVFEYMETDLHAVLRANILEDIHKRYIMYQLFRALKYLHSAELLHRDVKVWLLS